MKVRNMISFVYYKCIRLMYFCNQQIYIEIIFICYLLFLHLCDTFVLYIFSFV